MNLASRTVTHWPKDHPTQIPVVAGKTVQGFLLQMNQTGPLVVLLICEWPAATLLPWRRGVLFSSCLGSVKTSHYSYRSSQNHARLDPTPWYWSFWNKGSAAWKYKLWVEWRDVLRGATMCKVILICTKCGLILLG